MSKGARIKGYHDGQLSYAQDRTAEFPAPRFLSVALKQIRIANAAPRGRKPKSAFWRGLTAGWNDAHRKEMGRTRTTARRKKLWKRLVAKLTRIRGG